MSESQTNLAWDTLLAIDPSAGGSALHQRITSALREAVRDGRLPAGSALPPSRLLADQLGCSRWAVTEAYEQLVAEGYLEARVGSGTRVMSTKHESVSGVPAPASPPAASRIDLRPELPDLRAFPRAAWSKALRTVLASVPYQELAYPPPGGHPRLRRLIAEYLRRVRGTNAMPGDVTITTGIADGIARISRTLAAAGARDIAVEDPSWRHIGDAARNAGLNLLPVKVDEDGMRVELLQRSGVRAVVTTPAHQFPTGSVLSPRRRATLLEWASSTGALVLEDDYDSEFRYDRRPVGALQGIDSNHVALMGSVSKTLAPALRLGWIVSPPVWTEALRKFEGRMTGPAVLDQLALAELIESGDYARHLRRVRASYKARRDRLTAALAMQLRRCEISGVAAGFHVALKMPPGVAASSVRRAAGSALQLMDARECWLDTNAADEVLVIGFGNLLDGEVERAVEELANAIRSVEVGGSRREPAAARTVRPDLRMPLARRERIEKA